MYRNKFVIGIAFLLALVFGVQTEIFAIGKKKGAKFIVRIENVSDNSGLEAKDGTKYPFDLSPGLFVLTKSKNDFFKTGKRAHAGLEAQAEDGNPEILAKSLLTKLGSVSLGIFNTPLGANAPAPILPGGAYEFEFEAFEGTKLNFAAMFGQSNDLFYAPLRSIDLFEKGEPLTGDITDKLMLWDAGTEINQAPGIGADQGPRQKGPNTGADENGVVSLVKDEFSYPNVKDVLKVTITRK